MGSSAISPQARYLLRRLFYAALTVLALITITFFLMHQLPGDPFMGNRMLRPEVIAALTAKYGLDRSVLAQYGIYLARVFTGDLGNSLISGREVTDIISQAFPVSMELGLRALIFALILGLGMGITAALKHGSRWDTGLTLLSLLGASIPSFLVGALLQYTLALGLYRACGLHIFAVTGWAGESSKLLPSFALAFSCMAIIARLMRASMLEVLGQDYIRAAKAKGLTTRCVVCFHCLKNAVTPVITVLGPLVAVLFTGAFAVENVFAIPGLGRYFVQSVQSNDYPVVVGTTLFFGAFLVLANLVVDMIYCLLDPRITLDGGGL